jgi:thiol-disulfide isomerase/thioredoxin
MQRRTWIYGSVGALACAMGAGAAWWRMRPSPVASGTIQSLWDTQFDGLNGQQVSMRSFQGQKLLINFWATWCPPCVQEMPLIDRFYLENRSKGWQVLAIAADRAESVERFVREKKLQLPVAIGQAAALEWSRQLGNTAGGLPYTVVLSARGEIIHQRIGQLSEQDLLDWLQP